MTYQFWLNSGNTESDLDFDGEAGTINDFFVSIYLKKKIDYKQLINSINYYSNNKIFHKFKKKTPKNINDIHNTKNFVYEKLSNWGI